MSKNLTGPGGRSAQVNSCSVMVAVISAGASFAWNPRGAERVRALAPRRRPPAPRPSCRPPRREEPWGGQEEEMAARRWRVDWREARGHLIPDIEDPSKRAVT